MWTEISGQSVDYPLVVYIYNGFGQVKQVKTYAEQGGSARITEYTHDKNGRVTAIDHPSPLGDEYFAYDGVGSLVGKKDGAAVVTAYEYDALNRLVKVKYNYPTWPVDLTNTPIVDPDVTYSYWHATDLIETMSYLDGGSTYTTGYTYDHRGRVTSYAPPLPVGYGTINYEYDNANNKVSMIAPQGSTLYAYLRNGWLESLTYRVTNNDVLHIGYEYNECGDVSASIQDNQTESIWSYDPVSRLSGVVHRATGGPTLASVTYTRDGVGSPLTAEWTNGGSSWTATYTYDELNQLRTENHPYPGPGSRAWNYDWVGNRLDTGFVYDPQTDQLLEGPAGILRQYLTTGSLWTRGSTTFSYDYRELLSGISPLTVFGWMPDDTLVRATIGGSAYQFVYDPTASIAGAILQSSSTGDITYVRDPGGALVGRVGADGVKYYYFDGLGSTVLIADSAGNVTDRYDYGAWGEEYALQGTTSDNPYRYVGELGYYGYYQDPSLGLIQIGDRFYEPTTGRYILQRGMPYAYAMNNPTAAAPPPVQPAPSPVKPPIFVPDGKLPPNIRPVVPAGGGAVGTGGAAVAEGAGTIGAGTACILVAGAVAVCDLGYWASTGKACGPFTKAGEWIGQQLFPIDSDIAEPKPQPPPRRTTPRRRKPCNDKYEECKEFVANMEGLTPYQRSFFYRECGVCRRQCYWNAEIGVEPTWPDTPRCRFEGWPGGHRY